MTCGNALTLCVFIDAFGWELAKRYPFLDDIASHKSPLETIFGYSSTCDPTIITGKLPREHGHFAFYTYHPAQSPFRNYRYLQLLPGSLMNRGRVRSKLSQIMKRIHGFKGYFQLYNMPFRDIHLFNYTEQRNIFEPGGINGGQPTIFDHLRAQQIPFCRPETFHEPTAIAQVEQTLQTGAIPFVYLFLGHLDAILHQYGATSDQGKQHIAWYDEQIRRLMKTASQHYQTTRLFVFSDHGMTDIREVYPLMEQIERTGLRFGEDYAAVYDSTMARFWFLNPNAQTRIESVLQAEPRGHIMSETELCAYGCDFPHHAYGELFFLMNPGILICPSHMGAKPLAAMHGYAPEDHDSTASFMTNTPLASPPKRLDDLYRLMHDEIGIHTAC